VAPREFHGLLDPRHVPRIEPLESGVHPQMPQPDQAQGRHEQCGDKNPPGMPPRKAMEKSEDGAVPSD
jgi:hypothetical protein